MDRNPKTPKDDTGKIQLGIAKSVVVGKNAKVLIGNMQTAVLRVNSRGKNGIVVEDAQGRQFNIFWSNVMGPSSAAIDDLAALGEKNATEQRAMLDLLREIVKDKAENSIARVIAATAILDHGA